MQAQSNGTVSVSLAPSHIALLARYFDGSVQVLSKKLSQDPKLEDAPLVLEKTTCREVHHSRPKRTSEDVDDFPPPDGVPLATWRKRKWLCSKFDEGIVLRDAISWFSVTAEPVAKSIARRCACDVLLDAFAGAGGNVIQFAQTCKLVIGVEIDSAKILDAAHNGRIYGVDAGIDFVCGDAIHFLSSIPAVDVVFLSPPWGGPGYQRQQRFSMRENVTVMASDGTSWSGVEIFRRSREIARKGVAYYLPRNVTPLSLTLELGEAPCVFEYHLVGAEVYAVCAYFGAFT